MKPQHAALAVLVAIIWGVNFVAIELGLRDVPPLVFVALRFALVAVPAIFFVPKPAVPWRVIAGVGVFMSAGQFGLVYLAMHWGMPSGLAPLVLQSQMFFTILLAGVALKERPTTAQLAGVGAGAIGLVLVALGRGAVAPLGPLVLVVLAGLSWGIGNTISRTAKGASGLGLVVWSAAVVPYTLLVPPVGMAAAWLAFGELPQPLELAGGAMLLAGVAVTFVRRRPSRAAARSNGLAEVSP